MSYMPREILEKTYRRCWTSVLQLAIVVASQISDDPPVTPIANAGVNIYRNGDRFPVLIPSRCVGREQEWTNCGDALACEHGCNPEHCSFSDWSNWQSMGGCIGLCSRQRGIATSNNDCGNPCLGKLVETVASPGCRDEKCKTRSFQDCSWSQWSEWSACIDSVSEGIGQSYRVRQVLHEPQGESAKPCQGPWNQTRPCGDRVAVDCALSSWGDWSSCSFSCDGGWRSRVRRVVQKALRGGVPCDGAIRSTGPCNAQPCGKVEECKISEWSDWVGCSSGGGEQRYRTRSIAQSNKHTYKACNVSVRETDGCRKLLKSENPPCELASWSAWGLCSGSCEGQKTRTRVVNPALAGQGCRWEPPKRGSAIVTRETLPCGHETCWLKPRSVILAPWSHWSPCSQTCGKGISTRTRAVDAGGSSIGGGVNGVSMSEVRPCVVDGCGKIDCQWGEWDEWSACTCTCSGGTKKRTRVIAVAPRAGGRLCEPLDESEVAPCATQRCEICIDGAWGPWDEWGSCSTTCGPAYRVRHRDIARRPSACGLAASGLEDEYQKCPETSCEATFDCELSDWDEWSDCTCTCYGNKERIRHIIRYAAGDGSPCVDKGLKQISPCHPGPGEDPPPSCELQHRDCAPNIWAEWSSCSASCDGGQRTRTRGILSPNVGHGRPCDVALAETAPCKVETCSKKLCLDCLWGPWSDWGDCTKCGGQRYRHRQIQQMPNKCGSLCDGRAAKEAGACPSRCVEAVFCVWSQWDDIGGCTGSCGGPPRVRQRQLELVMERPAASAEPFADVGYCLDANGESYEGYLAKTGPQDTSSACAIFLEGLGGVPGVQGAEWSEQTSSCVVVVDTGTDPRSGADMSGLEFATDGWRPGDAIGPIFAADGQPGHQCWHLFSAALVIGDNNMPCSGSQTALVECAASQPCRADCVSQHCTFAEWSPWTQISCASQLCERSRTVEFPNKCGGSPCGGALSETRKCAKDCSETRDCSFQEWQGWNLPPECELPQQRFRRRGILQETQGTGRQCEGELAETESCGPPGGPSVHCVIGPWTQWLDCTRSCGGGVRARSRSIKTPASGGGAPCESNLSELEPCDEDPCQGLSAPCVLSEWEAWGDCTSDNLSFRQRSITQQPGYLGLFCVASLKEAKHCDLDPEDCRLSAWSVWDTCDRACGAGQQQRHRQVDAPARRGGKTCGDVLVETRGCNTGPCEEFACKVNDWSDWASCSSECGTGQRFRRRFLTPVPMPGSPGCTLDLSEAALCTGTGKNCVATVDCSWGEWTGWSSCSLSCDGGQRRRTRDVSVKTTAGGEPCAQNDKEEIAACNTQPCSEKVCIDGEWSEWGEWSACSKSCEGGTTWRSRKTWKEANDCGQPALGLSTENKACNLELSCAPSIDCRFGSWLEWTTCTKPCHGLKRRSRTIEVQGQGNGAVCEGPLKQTWACNEICNDGFERVDCEFAAWEQWDACSVTCDQGQRQRQRRISRSARGGGKGCAGALTQVAKCLQKPCEACQPVDCYWGEWEEWGVCDKCGGQMKRHRSAGVRANCGGRACEAADSEETTNCTRQCHEVKYCAWEDWGSWSRCSTSCGLGRKSRERRLKPFEHRPLDADMLDGDGKVHIETIKDFAELSPQSANRELEIRLQHIIHRTSEIEEKNALSLALAFTLGVTSCFALSVIVRKTVGKDAGVSSTPASAQIPLVQGYTPIPTEVTPLE